MEPFVGEDSSDFACGAGNWCGKKTGAEGGTVDEEVKLVGGVASIVAAVEGDCEDSLCDAGGGDGDFGNRALANDDAGKINLAIGSEAIFVKFTEKGKGAVSLPQGLPM